MPGNEALRVLSFPDGTTACAFRDISTIDAADWDACAGADNPFIQHAYLSALEGSGAVARNTGIIPRHMAILGHDNKILGVVPAYVKAHSNAEYGTDLFWHKVYAQHGHRYYPKLQVEVPYTPVSGPRLLVRPDANQIQTRTALVLALKAFAAKARLSSLHFNYVTRQEWSFLKAAGMLADVGWQLHWSNRNYRSFADFLAALRKRRRHAMRDERRKAVPDDCVIESFSGETITPERMSIFYRFYASTNQKYGAPAYLGPEFFRQVGRTMTSQLLLTMLRRADTYIAGVLNFLGSDTVYTRYWGAQDVLKFLHFELCYYQAVEYAIRESKHWINAGVGGRHKLLRGYLPVDVYHAHWPREERFRKLVSPHLSHKAKTIRLEKDEFLQHSPYRRGFVP